MPINSKNGSQKLELENKLDSFDLLFSHDQFIDNSILSYVKNRMPIYYIAIYRYKGMPA